MSQCTCRREAYWSEFQRDGATWMKCFGCTESWPKESEEHLPKIKGDWRGLMTRTEFEQCDASQSWWWVHSPWPSMPHDVAVRHRFAVAEASDMVEKYPEWVERKVLGNCIYLVLPVYDEFGRVVWFTARAMGSAPRPYLTPPGVPVTYWRSWALGPKHYGPVAITEGIGDAAFLSTWCDAVALCGMSYNGALDREFAGRDIIVAFDGDVPGLGASAVVGQRLSKSAKSVRLFSKMGKDPTDFSVNEVQEMLHGLNG